MSLQCLGVPVNRTSWKAKVEGGGIEGIKDNSDSFVLIDKMGIITKWSGLGKFNSEMPFSSPVGGVSRQRG